MRRVLCRVGMSAVCLCAAPMAAFSDEPPAAAEPATQADDDPSVAGARDFMNETMQLVEKQKWKEFKARIHPLTMKTMEERKARTKKDNHNLSFWSHIKEWKFQTWSVDSVEPGPRSTAIVTTKEDHFMIEEKGVEENKSAEWLLVKVAPDGKGEPRWWILDRRNGSANFAGAAIEKGFGDALPPPAADEKVAAKTPLAVYQKQLGDAVRGKLHIPEDIPASQLKVMKATAKIMLDEGGGILSRTIVRASGNPAFDKAIIRAIDAAQPLPAPDNGVVKEARNGVEVEFKGRP